MILKLSTKITGQHFTILLFPYLSKFVSLQTNTGNCKYLHKSFLCSQLFLLYSFLPSRHWIKRECVWERERCLLQLYNVPKDYYTKKYKTQITKKWLYHKSHCFKLSCPPPPEFQNLNWECPPPLGISANIWCFLFVMPPQKSIFYLLLSPHPLTPLPLSIRNPHMMHTIPLVTKMGHWKKAEFPMIYHVDYFKPTKYPHFISGKNYVGKRGS